MTVILVTHEIDISTYATRVVKLRDGLIIQDAAVKDRRDARRDLIASDNETPEDIDKRGSDGEAVLSARHGPRASYPSQQTDVSN
jgi:ABC-type phosphate/phosphonate transport system ATPase subunit